MNKCYICGQGIDSIINRKIKEAQKELLEDMIQNDVTDFSGYNGISLIEVENRLKVLNKG